MKYSSFYKFHFIYFDELVTISDVIHNIDRIHNNNILDFTCNQFVFLCALFVSHICLSLSEECKYTLKKKKTCLIISSILFA